jgi:nitrous oxide reductase accessory protein NosL
MKLNLKTRTASFIFLFCFIMFQGPALAGERRECSLCGMYLDQYESTVHVIVFKDGTRQETCSLACAAKVYAKEKARIKTVLAADFLTGSIMDAERAVYLEGSDFPGVMSYTSRIAFRSKDDAKTFQKKHGGKIVTFTAALQHQLKE